MFRFAAGPQFQSNFAAALTGALNDLGVQPAIVRTESSAVEFAAVVPLRDRQLSNSLQHAQFFCDIEFSYHTDLRIIQRNLNNLPHPNRQFPVRAW